MRNLVPKILYMYILTLTSRVVGIHHCTPSSWMCGYFCWSSKRGIHQTFTHYPSTSLPGEFYSCMTYDTGMPIVLLMIRPEPLPLYWLQISSMGLFFSWAHIIFLFIFKFLEPPQPGLVYCKRYPLYSGGWIWPDRYIPQNASIFFRRIDIVGRGGCNCL